MPTITVIVPLTDRKLLDQICEARGEDLSDFVRRAIKRELASLGYASEEAKKALGLLNSGDILDAKDK